MPNYLARMPLAPYSCLPFARALGLHRSVRKTPKVWGGGVLFFWGRGGSARQRAGREKEAGKRLKA